VKTHPVIFRADSCAAILRAAGVVALDPALRGLDFCKAKRLGEFPFFCKNPSVFACRRATFLKGEGIKSRVRFATHPVICCA